MFSKAKPKSAADERQTAAVAGEPVGASTASSSGSQSKRSSSMKAAGVPSIISADVVMRGNINAGGEVQFDGTLEGDIKAASLIIGEKASVKGEIVCESVTVRGRVEGSIRAKQVALAATSHIIGDILHSSLSVESGAHFEGNCRHSDDPLSEAAAGDFRKMRPVAAPPPTPRPVSPASVSAGDDTHRGASEAPAFLGGQNRASPLR